MGLLKRCHPAVLRAGVVAVVAYMALLGVAVAQQPAEKKWSPQFPREGATKLFENEHIIVWEQIGRPKEPFAHKHIRDILTFGVEPGRVEVLGPDLQPPTGSPGGSLTERLYSRGTSSLSYSQAGLGPHVELAPDPDNVPISIFVEIKGTEPADCAQWSTGCQ
jgi:hypothetical protein